MSASTSSLPDRNARPRRAIPAAALTCACLFALAIVLGVVFGAVPAGQATLNGLIAGSYLAIGALGLTLVFGVLRLVNFAHGDMLTLGAYATIGFTALGAPFYVAVPAALLVGAVAAMLAEKAIWRPMRNAGAGTLQMFLSAIGLALLLRHVIQFIGGGQARTLGIDTLTTFEVFGLRVGIVQVLVLGVGIVAMAAVGIVLGHTRAGKEMRAYADNRSLAEVSGIDTMRVVRRTWIASGGLAALAGILYGAAIGTFNPNFGITVLLSLFAAAIVGGIGNAYGALLGGLLIGLTQEWSTLLFNPRWKPAVGFSILILTLLFMPNGIFGKKRRRS